jgi:hypothetical protein
VVLVRTDILEEPSASIIRVTRIGEVATLLKNAVIWDVHHQGDNLADICEPIVLTMWDPQNLPLLKASTTCYGDSFTFLYVDDVCTS